MPGFHQAETALRADPRPQEPTASRRRVLVIEDDRELREALVRAAQSVDPGLEVEFVENADDAVQRLMQPRSYHLVLADFMLPESRSGYWLRPHCETLQPKAVFAMMSSMPLRPGAGQGCPFLRKPFTLTECAEFMRGVLA